MITVSPRVTPLNSRLKCGSPGLLATPDQPRAGPFNPNLVSKRCGPYSDKKSMREGPPIWIMASGQAIRGRQSGIVVLRIVPSQVLYD